MVGAGVVAAVILRHVHHPVVGAIIPAYALIGLACLLAYWVTRPARGRVRLDLGVAAVLTLVLLLGAFDYPVDTGAQLLPAWTHGRHAWKSTDPDVERGISRDLRKAAVGEGQHAGVVAHRGQQLHPPASRFAVLPLALLLLLRLCGAAGAVPELGIHLRGAPTAARRRDAADSFIEKGNRELQRGARTIRPRSSNSGITASTTSWSTRSTRPTRPSSTSASLHRSRTTRSRSTLSSPPSSPPRTRCRSASAP